MADRELTRERFRAFINMEKEIMDSIQNFFPWYSGVLKEFEEHGTSYHDFKISLINQTVSTVQVQITNYGNDRCGYCRYHDIRLDLVSSFDPWGDECREKYHDFSWRWKTLNSVTELIDFSSLCKVSKWGKLKTCDAKIFVFGIAKLLGRGSNRHIDEIVNILLFDNTKLKSNCDYFVNNYGVKINHKTGEAWGSAFVPVSEDDLILRSCLINNKDQFLSACES